jgi:hypothetical protein
MRSDIAQALNDLKPGVFRFPGGCIVEGTTLETRYQWKNTVGAVEDRPLNINRWFYTFFDRLFPIISSHTDSVFMNIFSCAKILVPMRCLSSIAEWPASSRTVPACRLISYIPI